MKVSELIEKLSGLAAEHGDLEVFAHDFGCGCCGDYVNPDPSLMVMDRFDTIYCDTRHLEVGDKVIRLN